VSSNRKLESDNAERSTPSAINSSFKMEIIFKAKATNNGNY